MYRTSFILRGGAAVAVSVLCGMAHSQTSYEILGPMASWHSQQSVVRPYNESHEGLGFRATRPLIGQGLAHQAGAYIFSDSFRTSSMQAQYGLRTVLADTSRVRWEAAVNANLFYKGVNWRGGRDWKAVPSLDLMATYDRGLGLTLSYYPYNVERRANGSHGFSNLFTLKVHYRFRSFGGPWTQD